jgi:hypothetical protein
MINFIAYDANIYNYLNKPLNDANLQVKLTSYNHDFICDIRSHALNK